MAIRHAHRPVATVLATLLAAAGLVVAGAAPAGAADPWSFADPPISTELVTVPMVFPVIGGASYTDTFGDCRSGCTRKHLGQDLMAPKMRPLVAVFSGTISFVRKETRVGDGNYFSLTGNDGWTVNYIHVNNDTPGTDDGRGTATWSMMPGLRVGTRVFAGQLLGWSGDSGNAESTSPHTHFELRRGDAWQGTVYNAYRSLRAASALRAPAVSGPHPDGALLTAGDLGGWVIRDGLRWRILWDNLDAHGHTLARVIRVTTAELTSYPSGGWAPLPDGLVVRGPGGDRWVVADGERIIVPLATDLADIGTSTDRLVAIDQASIDRTPRAEDQTLPGYVRPGALLLDVDMQIKWYVENGTRRVVANAGTMRSWGWTTAMATRVSANTIAAIPEGPPMKLRDGTVFTSPAGNWYVVSRGERRSVASAVARKEFGWDRLPYIEATLWSTSLLPAGATLP